MYPLVSVIIPTKNEESNIVRCLQSIKNQNYKGEVRHRLMPGKIEIIIVDNHSQDKTVALARRFTQHVYIAGNERSSQRNIGSKKAKGKWLLFIDADMELSKNAVTDAVSLAQNKQTPTIIAIKEKAIGYTFLTRALSLEKNCYNNARWLIAARFFPRKKFLTLGGYDETLISGEDWAITQTFLSIGYKLHIPQNTFIYHHEAKKSLKKLLQKEMYYIQHIDRYAQKYPQAFSYQKSFLYRSSIWLNSWHDLIKHPLLTATFLCYKCLVWILWSTCKFEQK